MKLYIPLAKPNRNLKATITGVEATNVRRLVIPMRSAKIRLCLLDNLFFARNPIMAPTKHPKGNIPLMRDKVDVVSSEGIYLFLNILKYRLANRVSIDNVR